MKTWEYTSIGLFGTGSQDELDAMSRLGAQGWELTTTIHLEDERRAIHYFKRPIEDRWYAERTAAGADIELALTGENGEGEEHDIIADAFAQQAAAATR
jgi:sugar (pentulose or hexulose) kinase